jgi:hypothetical protein
MSKSRYTTYELKLEGDAEALTILKECLVKDFLPTHYATIAEANAARRAVATLFRDKVEAKVVSVKRVPARTTRRVLRI